jgi:hypothetical protein
LYSIGVRTSGASIARPTTVRISPSAYLFSIKTKLRDMNINQFMEIRTRREPNTNIKQTKVASGVRISPSFFPLGNNNCIKYISLFLDY